MAIKRTTVYLDDETKALIKRLIKRGKMTSLSAFLREKIREEAGK